MELEEYLEVIECKPPPARRISADTVQFHQTLARILEHASGQGQHQRGTARLAVLSAPQEIISLP